MEYCKLFMKKLGISPFMKIFNNKNCVSASIIGCQYKILQLIADNSKIDEYLNQYEAKYVLKD